MNQKGTIKRGTEIGYKKSGKYIYYPCADCGKLRWVQFCNGQPRWARCRSCGGKIKKVHSRESHYRWNGGTTRDKSGYILENIPKESKYWPMTRNDYKRRTSHMVLQHRLVMAQSLNRCLSTHEHVHHLNGIKDDNRIENLALVNVHSHEKHTIKRLYEKRIRELEECLSKYMDK